MNHRWLIHNLVLKLTALSLAIVTWYYVNHTLIYLSLE